MKELSKAKKQYKEIEIPDELSGLVQETIERATIKRKHIVKRKSYFKISSGIAAACFLGFIVCLNTSETFAKAMEDIPVISSVAQLFTIRSYNIVDKDKEIIGEVPKLEQAKQEDKEEITNFIVDINKEIESLVEMHVEEAEQMIKEYKEAFLETGGTEEEFAQHNIKANVGYSIKSQTKNRISFVITSEQNWVNAYNMQYYYNLDLETGKKLTLQDILGEDYIAIANKSITEQMKERENKNKDYMYFTKEEGGFSSIEKDTSFYINEKGNVVIVFETYAIAPGFMGIQEFEIK